MVDPNGSMQSYIELLGRRYNANYQIHLYNGNWDAVVPYKDTISAIGELGLREEAVRYNLGLFRMPWFTDGQHSGFQQLYGGLLLTIVKGGSHQVPMSKRK